MDSSGEASWSGVKKSPRNCEMSNNCERKILKDAGMEKISCSGHLFVSAKNRPSDKIKKPEYLKAMEDKLAFHIDSLPQQLEAQDFKTVQEETFSKINDSSYTMFDVDVSLDDSKAASRSQEKFWSVELSCNTDNKKDVHSFEIENESQKSKIKKEEIDPVINDTSYTTLDVGDSKATSSSQDVQEKFWSVELNDTAIVKTVHSSHTKRVTRCRNDDMPHIPCSGENSTNIDVTFEEEDPALRKRRMARERHRRWMAKQSEESLAKIRALDAEAHKRRKIQLSAEQLMAYRAANSVCQQRRIQQMSSEKLESHRTAHAASQQRHVDRLTPLQSEAYRTAHSASQQRRILSMSAEELLEYCEARAASHKRRVARLTPQQLDARRATNAACLRSRERQIRMMKNNIQSLKTITENVTLKDNHPESQQLKNNQKDTGLKINDTSYTMFNVAVSLDVSKATSCTNEVQKPSLSNELKVQESTSEITKDMCDPESLSSYCDRCFFSAALPRMLRIHGLFGCRIEKHKKPNTPISEKSQLKEIVLACDKCDFKANKEDDLNKHSTIHIEIRPYICNYCDYTSKCPSYMKRHKLIHSGERPYMCDSCDYRGITVSDVKKHYRIHTLEKRFSCQSCSYKCKFAAELRRHNLTHTELKPFACNICSYTGKSMMQLKKHQGVHDKDKKTIKCDACSYECKALFELKRHYRSHTQEKPFNCDECSYSCNTSSSLKRHKLTHSGLKPYTCKFCDYKCRDSSSLKNHTLIHSDNKPLKCSMCSYSCKKKAELRMHNLTHTNERRFDCAYCSFKAKTSHYLMIHQRTHSGEKPFSCSFCDYTCKSLPEIKKHNIKHVI